MPFKNEKEKTITAPDLRKPRQTALIKELLKPKYQAYGFRTADILPNLAQHFRNSAQIRYEMNKLRARGIIEKIKNKAFYKVTSLGWKWIWLEITSQEYFKNPIISKIYKNELIKTVEQPNKIEEAYVALNHGLTTITQELPLCS